MNAGTRESESPPGRRAPAVDGKPRRTASADAVLPRVSPWLLRWFRWYSRRYVARHFHAVRLAHAGRPEVPGRAPLVVYMNHAAWWDPLIGLCLASKLFSERKHYAPVEAGALGQYRFMERLGFFGIDPATRRGAARFLRVSLAVLARPGTALWITPEGRFADPRERPVRLRGGLARLARRLQTGAVLPLAVEYPFWEERLPEALVQFGQPLQVDDHRDTTLPQWNELLRQRLEAAQDALAERSMRRDPDQFEVLLHGSAGVGGVYDMWRRAWARLRGRQFRPEHGKGER